MNLHWPQIIWLTLAARRLVKLLAIGMYCRGCLPAPVVALLFSALKLRSL
jgi:hypothetical protein